MQDAGDTSEACGRCKARGLCQRLVVDAGRGRCGGGLRQMQGAGDAAEVCSRCREREMRRRLVADAECDRCGSRDLLWQNDEIMI